jgi:hypothetical protein
MRRPHTTAFVAGAVFAVVVGGGTAVAATGGTFILGRSNTAGTVTTLSNANGSALSLNSKLGTSSLRVNRTTKVPNLNADLLDSLNSSAFARTSGQTGTLDFTGALQDLDNNGLNDTIVAFADCPPGTQMTGGGGTDQTATGIMFVNAPDVGESWVVAVGIDENTVESPADVIASVVCYNPQGAVPGAGLTATSPNRTLSPKTAAKLATKVATQRSGR